MKTNDPTPHIAVLGCGESGIAAATLLIEGGAMVTILDTATRDTIAHRVAFLDQSRLRLVAGADATRDTTRYHRAILSPGIDPAAPLVQNLLNRRIEMIGELELAFEACRCPIIGITGTNGKTTTTGLVESMFRVAGLQPVAGGNLGPAFSAIVRSSADADVAVVEISSFQLERIRAFRPDVAVWLNFSPDHLDRYGSVAEYRAAKLRIFENQTEEDFAVVHADEVLPETTARRITFSARSRAGDFGLDGDCIVFRGDRVLDMRDTRLRGLHNAENLMAALGAGFARGLSIAACLPGLCSYHALPHRNEFLAEIGGVRFINDSKATNPSSLAMALESQKTPVVLIAGGKEKGVDFSEIHALIAARVKAAILIGECAGRMAREWNKLTGCHAAVSLSDAVRQAAELAQPGDVVLLSPGTSSYDMFKDFSDRGNQFRSLVGNLAQLKQTNTRT